VVEGLSVVSGIVRGFVMHGIDLGSPARGMAALKEFFGGSGDGQLVAELNPERSGFFISDAHRHVEHARRAVDNNSFVPKKVPLIRWSIGAPFCAWQYRANHNEASDEDCPPAEPVSIAEPSIRLTLINTHLTREQLECLSRCAKGISVRLTR
jgi:hypothetical protein